MPKYHYAIVMGGLYRFTQRNWRNYCKVSALQWAPVEAYADCIQMDCPNITDWQPEAFADQIN